ncbi:MAG: iron-containing alcohol dehydrogenase [Thermodesulfobacteriota bacterium]
MNPPGTFRCPRDIHWGRGSLAHLETMGRKRVLIVTDAVMTRLGVTARAEELLRKGGAETQVFDAVEPEPSIDTVQRILKQYGDFAPQVILGIGGGSAIDASKGFRIFWEHPHLTFADVRRMEAPPRASIPPFTRTLHVAVPSTSGTGSEASYACILNDPVLSVKCPILSAELIPDRAIVDPDLADSMPPAVLADSGLDALTHAVESYVNLRASDFSRGLSLQAITLIMRHLPAAFLERAPLAMEHMHYAGTIAGLAFSNSSNGICHTIADKVGARFNLTHGRANAIALPFTIQYNRTAAGTRFTEIAVAIGHQGKDADAAIDQLVQGIRSLEHDLQVPGSFRQAGIPENLYYASVDEFAEKSLTFGPTLVNPRKPTIEELRELFIACYEGEYRLR